MKRHEAITTSILKLYKQISSALDEVNTDAGKVDEEAEVDSSGEWMASVLRTLSAELESLLMVEEAPYPMETEARLITIEREITAAIGRIQAMASYSNKRSQGLSW